MVARRPLVVVSGTAQEMPTGDTVARLVPTSTKTANYTASPSELVICDASGGSFTVTLPAASASVPVAIRKADNSSNAVVVAAAGSDTIGVVNPVSSVALVRPTTVLELIGKAGAWISVSAPVDPDAWLGMAVTATSPGVSPSAWGIGTYFARVIRGQARLATKIGFNVLASSGNVSAAIYRNSGNGRSAFPSGAAVASVGSTACPGLGYNELTLGAAVDVAPGDWLAFSADNTTIRLASQAVAGTVPAGVWVARQATAGFPAPASVGTLVSASLVPELYAVA